MTAKLRIVCTPIGNFGDMPARATEALRTAAVILAEDTRHSRPLLDRLGVTGPRLVSCHQHNELERLGLVVELLGEGQAVALITDAGAPAVSDPGSRLAAAVLEAGFEVEVFPGPSAVVAALMGAAVDATRFAFLGFVARKAGSRSKTLERAAASGMALVLYEAANRVSETLQALYEACGERRVVVARELTKAHETFHRGRLGGDLAPPFVEKGECVIVVEAGEATAVGGIERVEDVLRELVADQHRPLKLRSKELARRCGIAGRDAYRQLLEAEAAASHRLPDPVDVVEKVKELLAEAGRTLASLAPTVEWDEDRIPSDIVGADELMAFLERDPLPVAAPVEARETAKALLGALSAADALEDALAMMAEAEAARQKAGRE